MSSRADKLWDEARWIELARSLGSPLVLPWGSEPERARVERIAAGLPQAEVPPRRSLEELAALFAGARSVIGVDTGLTHLAAALGTPTRGIYCGSDPALTGLYGAPAARNLGAPGRPPSVAEVLASLP
jgi:heptosyltransferase-1